MSGLTFFIESLILAQDKRWRHALHMQVERTLLFRILSACTKLIK
jgi:hypothetical protein